MTVDKYRALPPSLHSSEDRASAFEAERREFESLWRYQRVMLRRKREVDQQLTELVLEFGNSWRRSHIVVDMVYVTKDIQVRLLARTLWP